MLEGRVPGAAKAACALVLVTRSGPQPLAKGGQGGGVSCVRRL